MPIENKGYQQPEGDSENKKGEKSESERERMEKDEKEKEYGINEFKNEIMEGVPLDEIQKRDIKWCAVQWYMIMGLTHDGRLADEVFEDPERYYGFVIIELEKRIKALGGKVVSMKNIEIPK